MREMEVATTPLRENIPRGTETEGGNHLFTQWTNIDYFMIVLYGCTLVNLHVVQVNWVPDTEDRQKHNEESRL